MSCEIGSLAGKPCNTVSARGVSKVLAVPIHDIETITMVASKPNQVASIVLKSGKNWYDVTASKRKASATHTLEGDDPENKTWTHGVSLATAYLTAEKLETIDKFVGTEVMFFVKDRNKRYWHLGDMDSGLFLETAEGGTGSETDGENATNLTFTGTGFNHNWFEFKGDFDVIIAPNVFGYVAPPPVTP